MIFCYFSLFYSEAMKKQNAIANQMQEFCKKNSTATLGNRPQNPCNIRDIALIKIFPISMPLGVDKIEQMCYNWHS